MCAESDNLRLEADSKGLKRRLMRGDTLVARFVNEKLALEFLNAYKEVEGDRRQRTVRCRS